MLVIASLITSAFAVTRSQPALADHRFKVTNRGEHTIAQVHISGLSQSTYGPDLLGDHEYIEPGQSWSVTLTQGCVQDILIVYDDGHRAKDDGFDTCQYDLATHY